MSCSDILKRIAGDWNVPVAVRVTLRCSLSRKTTNICSANCFASGLLLHALSGISIKILRLCVLLLLLTKFIDLVSIH